MGNVAFLSNNNKERYLRLIAPIGNFFARTGVHPNILTFAGLLLSLVSGISYALGSFFWAAWILMVAGTCDVLDGQIARQTNKTSRFGAFLDSTLDRFSDMFPFIGLAYHFSGGQAFWGISGAHVNEQQTEPFTVLVIMIAMTGSFMVSYTRARAEGLGIECRGGIMQRPERISLLILGSLAGAIPWIGLLLLKCSLLILAVSAILTALYRMVFVRKEDLREKSIR